MNKNTTSSYLIIGSGRVATHFKYYFDLLGISSQLWCRRQPIEELEKLLLAKPTVFLAISDGALEDFFETYLKKHDLRVIHCSGAFQSASMISCHPLMTFGPDLYDLKTYQGIFFAVTGVNSVQDLFPALPNSSFILRASDKPFYHALCVLAAAGAQTLWKSCEAQLTHLGVPEKAFQLYLKQMSENYFRLGAQALTGPWARGDQKTISANLQALAEKSSPLSQLYQILKEGPYDRP